MGCVMAQHQPMLTLPHPKLLIFQPRTPGPENRKHTSSRPWRGPEAGADEDGSGLNVGAKASYRSNLECTVVGLWITPAANVRNIDGDELEVEPRSGCTCMLGPYHLF